MPETSTIYIFKIGLSLTLTVCCWAFAAEDGRKAEARRAELEARRSERIRSQATMAACIA